MVSPIMNGQPSGVATLKSMPAALAVDSAGASNTKRTVLLSMAMGAPVRGYEVEEPQVSSNLGRPPIKCAKRAKKAA